MQKLITIPKKIINAIAYVLIYVFSALPFKVLYVFSDSVAFLLYHVVRYRRELVYNNIHLAFPERPQQEKRKLVKKFYKDFCDHFVETIKLISISKKELHGIIDADYSVIDQLNKEGKSCYILLGHQFNWEMANSHFASVLHNAKNIVAYHPLSNNFFEKLVIKIRTRFGTIVTPYNKLLKGLLPHRNDVYNLILIADQNPSPADVAKAYWLPFFKKKVPFFSGPEKGARASNKPVVFVDIKKVTRGKYKITSSLLTMEPKLQEESVVSCLYSQKLQDSIKFSPSNYLWSHRRWRHASEENKMQNIAC